MGRITTVTKENVLYVIEHLRREDDLETVRSTGQSGAEVLVQGVDCSEFLRCIEFDDGTANIYGVAKGPGDLWVPWSMSTTLVDRHAREFLALSLEGIAEIKERYDRLVNFVDAEYTKSIRWLKRLGFTVNNPVPYGLNGEPFCPFWWSRHV